VRPAFATTSVGVALRRARAERIDPFAGSATRLADEFVACRAGSSPLPEK